MRVSCTITETEKRQNKHREKGRDIEGWKVREKEKKCKLKETFILFPVWL